MLLLDGGHLAHLLNRVLVIRVWDQLFYLCECAGRCHEAAIELRVRELVLLGHDEGL